MSRSDEALAAAASMRIVLRDARAAAAEEYRVLHDAGVAARRESSVAARNLFGGLRNL